MGRLAIIPARSGSKRIPGKNIKLFYGKPIISFSIEVAKRSGLFDEVMVSTDSDEIAEIAIKYGASVPFYRSEKNSDDFATTKDVINEVLSQYQSRNTIFEYSCCIYPTAPLITEHHLKLGYNKLKDGNYESVFPVVRFGYPIWRGLSINEDGKANMIWPENLNARSQDMKQVYHDAGQWYWLKSKTNVESIFSDRSGVIVLEENEVQDIDNIEDWNLTELKYQLKQK